MRCARRLATGLERAASTLGPRRTTLREALEPARARPPARPSSTRLRASPCHCVENALAARAAPASAPQQLWPRRTIPLRRAPGHWPRVCARRRPRPAGDLQRQQLAPRVASDLAREPAAMRRRPLGSQSWVRSSRIRWVGGLNALPSAKPAAADRPHPAQRPRAAPLPRGRALVRRHRRAAAGGERASSATTSANGANARTAGRRASATQRRRPRRDVCQRRLTSAPSTTKAEQPAPAVAQPVSELLREGPHCASAAISSVPPTGPRQPAKPARSASPRPRCRRGIGWIATAYCKATPPSPRPRRHHRPTYAELRAGHPARCCRSGRARCRVIAVRLDQRLVEFRVSSATFARRRARRCGRHGNLGGFGTSWSA